jgi:hypothetical protein
MESHCKSCGQPFGQCDLMHEVEGGFVCIQCEHAAKIAGRWMPKLVVGIGAAVVLIVAAFIIVV